MAKLTNLNIRTDAEVKAAAGHIFDLTMSTAARVKTGIPNDETAAAIQEGRALMQDRNAHGYKNTDDLRSALDV